MTIFSVKTYILELYLSILRFHFDELLNSQVYIIKRIVQCTCEIISTRSSWYNPSQKRGNYDSGGGNYTLSTLVSKCTIIIRLQSMDVHYIGIDWRDLQFARFCVFGIQRLPVSPVIPQSIHSLLCWGSAITAFSNARSPFQDLGSPTSAGSTSYVSRTLPSASRYDWRH